jgi:hypothetical protein
MNKDSEPKQTPDSNRRRFLQAIGTGAVATAGFTGLSSASHQPLVINLEHADLNNPDANMTRAKDALNDMANQLNVGIEIDDFGQAEGDYSGCSTYNCYIDTYRSEEYLWSGEMHLLLYNQGVSTGQALAGKASGSYRSGNEPVAVVNTETYYSHSETAYKNTVKHEIGHLIADGSNAPDYGNEHSFGSQYDKWYGREQSPMLTWYSGNENPAPDLCCNRSDINNSELTNGKLSTCSKDEMRRWLQNEY